MCVIGLFGSQRVSPSPKQALVFTCLQYKSFENSVEKGEIARKEQFLFFSTAFSTLSETFPPSSSYFKFLSANSFTLGKSKICHLG